MYFQAGERDLSTIITTFYSVCKPHLQYILTSATIPALWQRHSEHGNQKRKNAHVSMDFSNAWQHDSVARFSPAEEQRAAKNLRCNRTSFITSRRIPAGLFYARIIEECFPFITDSHFEHSLLFFVDRTRKEKTLFRCIGKRGWEFPRPPLLFLLR